MLPELLWLHPPHPHPKACSSLDINLQRIRFPSGAAVICIWMQLSMHCAWGKGSSKWLFFLFPFFFYWKLSRHLWSLSSCLIPHLNLWTHLKPYLGYSLEGCGRRFCSQKSKFQCFVKNGVPQGASLGPSVFSLARLQAGKKKIWLPGLPANLCPNHHLCLQQLVNVSDADSCSLCWPWKGSAHWCFAMTGNSDCRATPPLPLHKTH